MIKRLTERDEYGNADIIGVDSAELQLNLEFDELNRVTDALNRLAAYEDTKLTPRQIQAQQQEIEQHIKWNEAHTKARVEQAELIDKLVRDKDEQAGRIMRMESGLRRLKSSFQWLSEDMRGRGYKDWAEDKMNDIDDLLGGKDDAKKPQT